MYISWTCFPEKFNGRMSFQQGTCHESQAYQLQVLQVHRQPTHPGWRGVGTLPQGQRPWPGFFCRELHGEKNGGLWFVVNLSVPKIYLRDWPKTPGWMSSCVLSLENIGIRQFSFGVALVYHLVKEVFLRACGTYPWKMKIQHESFSSKHLHFFGLGWKKRTIETSKKIINPKKTTDQLKAQRPNGSPLKSVRQFLKTTQQQKTKEKLAIKTRWPTSRWPLMTFQGWRRTFIQKLWFFPSKKNNQDGYKVGPLPVITSVITPITMVITPITQL